MSVFFISSCFIRWQYVLQYSKTIGNLLGNPDSVLAPMIEDPRAILKVTIPMYYIIS